MQGKEILKWLEKSGSTQILLELYSNNRLTITQLKNRTVGGHTLYARLDELEKYGLINREERVMEEAEFIFKKVVIVSLTPKGKKVAEKLKEIKEILEEE